MSASAILLLLLNPSLLIDQFCLNLLMVYLLQPGVVLQLRRMVGVLRSSLICYCFRKRINWYHSQVPQSLEKPPVQPLREA